MIGSILIAFLAGPPAEGALPFDATTYSADEDSSWASGAEAAGNRFYIAGPGSDREAWIATLRGYRREMREEIRGLGQVDIAFRGVRAWVRMRKEFARAIDPLSEETFRIELEARWVEGNRRLVLALDLLDRSTGEWKGWSGAFSTLDVPLDRGWHRLVWEGRLPRFDRERTWARPIFGMDATHDPTPGKVSVRGFSFEVPESARGAVRDLLSRSSAPKGLDRSLYDREDLRWASGAFVCHFTFLYDLSFYDPAAGRYTLERFLEEGSREFGGYDALVLWHAYPRIGVDERNQFDFYRDLPGGLAGLAELTGEIHKRGIKVFIDYNPWDTGTRREEVPDEEAIATMAEAVGADGVFLDTMSAGGPLLRQAVDRRRKGVIFEPEGSPPIEEIEISSASWAQGFPELPEPGLLRLKWIEPRHLQHQIDRWSGSHRREIENAFFNGSGVLVWENVFGAWNPWGAADRAALRRAAPILRKFRGNLTSDAGEPFVATGVRGVFANAWPGEDATVWTILNRTGGEVREPVLRLPHRGGEAFFDLWGLERIEPPVSGDQVEVQVPLGPLGCVAAARGNRIEELAAWIARLREEERTAARPEAAAPPAAGALDPRPVEPSPPAAKDRPPPGMVLVPAGSVTMHLRHQRRECGCYPDPGTLPERRREFLWGAPFDGSIEHHVGPIALPAFFIDEHEVTNGEFARFMRESGYRPAHPENFLKHWGGPEPPAALRDHPVVYVDLEDARAYARWAGKRLPTEAEWHRAAQGDDGRAWPWGNEFDPSRVNPTGKGTEPVGSHPPGKSPFGCQDMSGNVWEWTESERSDGHTRFSIIRGGSYFKARSSVWYVEGGLQPVTSHTKFIHLWPGLDRCSTIGFRCVKDAVPESAGPVPLDRAHAHNDYHRKREP